MGSREVRPLCTVLLFSPARRPPQSMQVGGALGKAAAILLTHVVRTGLATIRALFSAENGSEIPYNA